VPNDTNITSIGHSRNHPRTHYEFFLADFSPDLYAYQGSPLTQQWGVRTPKPSTRSAAPLKLSECDWQIEAWQMCSVDAPISSGCSSKEMQAVRHGQRWLISRLRVCVCVCEACWNLLTSLRCLTGHQIE